jgi:hypothetical protein
MTRYEFLKQECPQCIIDPVQWDDKQCYRIDCGKNRVAIFGMELHETDSKRLKWVKSSADYEDEL